MTSSPTSAISVTRRGGTISELVAGLVALTLLAALVIPGAARMRADSRTASGLSQLRWIASVTSSYGADNDDQFWGYSWKRGELPHSDPQLPTSATRDNEAVTVQAYWILRRRADPDFQYRPFWVAQVRYHYLPLLDYLDRAAPMADFVAPADELRQSWLADPSTSPGSTERLTYSSSYEVSPAMWDASDVGFRVEQSGMHRSYSTNPSGSYGGVRISDTAHPAQKVFVHDMEQRLQPRRQFTLVAGSRVMGLCVDGSALRFNSAEVNPGWQPNSPASPEPATFMYDPTWYEAPTSTGEPEEIVIGRHRWTRGGIAGRDFGGPEVDTGQP